MKKVFYLLVILLTISVSGLAWSENELELTAPDGGELDLQHNVMKYYGDAEPVIARGDNFVLEAKYLEYQRELSVLTGKGQARLTQKTPFRTIRANEIIINQKQDVFSATGEVLLRYDSETQLAGNSLKWDRRDNTAQILDKAELTYNGWKVTGEKIDAQMNRGIIAVVGSAQAVNSENIIRAGKIIFNREAELLVLQEDPVLIRDNNEMSASEITYDLKTKKVSASGMVKTKIIQ